MARDTLDKTPITDRAELIDHIAAGEKPAERFRIGTEHEKLVFHSADLSPVSYEGETGIRALLEGMQTETGWEPITDEGNIIGLAAEAGGGAISIEPGGQFELSGAPLETLHETFDEAAVHLGHAKRVAERLGLGFLALGMAPTWRREAMPRMPKQRYAIMTEHMPKVGSRGFDMMYRTTTIQVNLDFSSEADMVAKMRVGLALQPIATALFANSPFVDGAPNGYRSNRGLIWQDVDLARSGPIPFAFDAGFGYEAYVDWALGVPMYFVKRGDRYIEATRWTFADFMAGRFDLLPGERPTMGDWINHLSTLFPEVRLKRFLEMRGADGGPLDRIVALPAFWVGLLYDDTALGDALELAGTLSREDRQTLWHDVPRAGLSTNISGRTAGDVAREALAIASDGLRRRARASGDMADERPYLAVLEESVRTGRAAADNLLAEYYGPWQRGIANVYAAHRF